MAKVSFLFPRLRSPWSVIATNGRFGSGSPKESPNFQILSIHPIPINTKSFSLSIGRLLTAQSRKRVVPFFTSEFAKLRTARFIYFTSNNGIFSVSTLFRAV